MVNALKLIRLHEKLTANFGPQATSPGVTELMMRVIGANQTVFNLTSSGFSIQEEDTAKKLEQICAQAMARTTLDRIDESIHGERFQSRFFEYYTEVVNELNTRASNHQMVSE